MTKLSTFDMIEVARVHGESNAGKWRMVYRVNSPEKTDFKMGYYKVFYDGETLLEIEETGSIKKGWKYRIKHVAVYSSYQQRIIVKFLTRFNIYGVEVRIVEKEYKTC